ncbi:putative Ig domain-containing protein, partial [Mesorhizobium norvegicum]|uniref:putative Ig domain-containing protein n=1 Tax=Mesorhizobium norvegicum TaxID=1085774 RepID=UPI00319DF27C
NTPPDANTAVNQIAELAAAGAATGITASATDPDAGSTVSYSLNDTRFAIDASTGVITRSATGTLDFETQPSINLTVTATSSDGSTANQAFTLAVLNSPEPVAFNTPPDADTAVNQITQNAAAGTAIGITASATDPDAGSTITYTINDSRFAINASTGVITRSGTGTLNATSEPSVNFNVTATSSDSSIDTHAFSVAVSGTGNTTPVTIETRVATAGDDVEEKGSGAISTNVTDLELGYDGSTRQTVGMRFTGINIPQGAIITNAYIQFQANEVKTGATSLLIQGDKVDDASPFTTASFNVSSLPRTTASTAWTPAPWTTVGEHGLAERTPDLSAVVQEIVNRSGWAALNDMAFLVTGTGTRTADSYESNPASAPLLHIEYTLPGPAGSPVAFNTPPDANPAANQIAELAPAGTAIGITASATDPDAGSTVAYSLNDTRFAIDVSSGVITRSATGTLDFETQTSINLTVTATSSDGSTANQAFTLAVLNSPEPVTFNNPPDANTAANQIAQNAAAGTAIGITASARDPDAGSTVTYSVNDSRFAINSSTGVVTRSGTGTLNAATEPSVNLHVTATSSDGSAAGQDYAVSVTTAPIFEKRIATSTDDVEQGPSGGMDLTSTDLDMVVDGTKVQTVGMRFTGVDIPYDAVITSAYIQFQAQNTSTGAVSLLIRGESDEAVPFESEKSDVTSRLMTTTSVTWTPPDWTVNNEAALAERTPNLSAIVQEIINQPGYLQLNDMAFVVSGSSGARRANSFDGSATGAPLLHVEYYVPTTGPVAFKHPQDADPAANQIPDRAPAGTLVHITASAKDPDVTDTVTYSLNDSRFAINSSTGVITRSGTGTLNAQTEQSINLHVTATSSDGSTAAQDYTVSVVPTTPPQVLYRYAVFGDYGDTDLSGEKAVSAMVHAWNPDFILTIGDNVYAPQTLDAAVGQQYHDYIGNYQGAYGSGSAINRFFPTLGNHEYEEGNVTNYLNYFTLPDNERYYDYQIGPVHFFALSSNKQEPDGRSSTSVQGHWMQDLLANSDASFDVAYFHHTPFNPSGSTATMRWPFEQWGVNAVFAGHQHNYYRENRDDNGDGVFLPYTTTGLGGAGKTVPNVGANLVTITDAGMLIEFYKVSSFNGTTATSMLTDSYFVPTPVGRTPTIVNGGYVLNGTTGADYLWGLGGNDTLIGGRGNDLLVAGNQHNLFVFAHGDGQDTVMNFLPGAGTGDVLDLRAFGIYNDSQFLQVATNQGSNVVASLGGGDQITLTGVQVAQFHDDNFLSTLLLA